MYVKVNIDGKETVTHEAWGETACSERARTFEQMVIPATLWDDREFMGDYKISFAQETRRVYIKGDLVGIIQRSKVINATYYNMPYHCEIIGDGTIQHFGIDLPDSPPCIHYVKCDRIVGQE